MMKSTLTLTAGLALTFGLGTAANAAVIIGGSTGNGDFNAGGGGTAGPAQPYDATTNWHNAGGADNINFTNSSQMGGSTDPNNGTTTRGGMPFRDRVQVNDTGYTASTGDVFSISYDFGAGGPPARWNDAETMRTFLFTTGVAVDGNITEADITEIAGSSVNYDIDRANDGQWTSFSASNFYTAVAGDDGQTLYFGMEFLDGNTSDGDLFPRIDIINLEVTPVPEPASLALLGVGGLAMLRRSK